MTEVKLVKMLQDPFMLELVNSLLSKHGVAEVHRQLGHDIDYHVFQEGEIDTEDVKDYLEVNQARISKVHAFLQAYQDLESERLQDFLR